MGLRPANRMAMGHCRKVVDDFKLHMPLTVWKGSPGQKELRIGGIVSTDGLDRQGEKVVQDGLDFSPFLEYGWFNDNHGQKTTDILGYPQDAFRVKKGEKLPNGKTSKVNGWWAEGYLLNDDQGQKLYGKIQALASEPSRRLGFSIEGKIKERDYEENHIINAALVKNVAITHVPVNAESELEALAKALQGGGLSAGSAISNPGPSAGEGFPLRKEALAGAPSDTGYGKDDEDDEDDEFNFLFETVAKSDDDMLTAVDFVDHWANSAADFLNQPVVDRLTKSEATIIVASRLPQLSPTARERLINGIED